MTRQIINIGTGPDSYTGDNLRTAFQKVNANFSELYSGNVASNISADAITANSITTQGSIIASNLTVSGNVGANYFTGNGRYLTGITANATTGNIGFNNQTITGTVSNSNIVIQTTGTGFPGVLLPNITRIRSLRVGNIESGGDVAFDVNTVTNTAFISTVNRGNGNVSIQIVANSQAGGSSIDLRSDNGHIGFGGSADGYPYTFYNTVKATEFYADADFPTGYQFTTPEGLTGINHVYQNDINGNISLVRIAHDNAVPAKFYENNHTILSGNLVVSQTGNVFGAGFPDAFVQVYSNANVYTQLVWQNLNSGSASTGDIVVTANDGTDLTYFGDFGIAGSNYDNTNPNNSLGTSIYPRDTYLYAQGNSPETTGGNLTIGAVTPTKVVRVIAGGINDSNVITTTSSTGLTLNRGNLILASGNAPVNSTDPGTPGQLAWDSNFVYVCVGANTWKRANLSTW